MYGRILRGIKISVKPRPAKSGIERQGDFVLERSRFSDAETGQLVEPGTYFVSRRSADHEEWVRIGDVLEIVSSFHAERSDGCPYNHGINVLFSDITGQRIGTIVHKKFLVGNSFFWIGDLAGCGFRLASDPAAPRLLRGYLMEWQPSRHRISRDGGDEVVVIRGDIGIADPGSSTDTPEQGDRT